MHHPISPGTLEKVQAELEQLETELVEIDGSHLKPSQCYHLETSPAHVLFNTNCPDSLKQRVQAILSKYIPPDESSTQQS